MSARGQTPRLPAAMLATCVPCEPPPSAIAARTRSPKRHHSSGLIDRGLHVLARDHGAVIESLWRVAVAASLVPDREKTRLPGAIQEVLVGEVEPSDVDDADDGVASAVGPDVTALGVGRALFPGVARAFGRRRLSASSTDRTPGRPATAAMSAIFTRPDVTLPRWRGDRMSSVPPRFARFRRSLGWSVSVWGCGVWVMKTLASTFFATCTRRPTRFGAGPSAAWSRRAPLRCSRRRVRREGEAGHERGPDRVHFRIAVGEHPEPGTDLWDDRFGIPAATLPASRRCRLALPRRHAQLPIRTGLTAEIIGTVARKEKSGAKFGKSLGLVRLSAVRVAAKRPPPAWACRGSPTQCRMASCACAIGSDHRPALALGAEADFVDASAMTAASSLRLDTDCAPESPSFPEPVSGSRGIVFDVRRVMSDPASTIAIEKLLEQRSWVRHLARALVFGHQDAEDLEQEAWLATLQAPPRHESSPRGWLATVMRRAASRSRRRAAPPGRRRGGRRGEAGGRVDRRCRRPRGVAGARREKRAPPRRALSRDAPPPVLRGPPAQGRRAADERPFRDRAHAAPPRLADPPIRIRGA